MNESLAEAWRDLAELLKRDGFYCKSPLKEIPDYIWSLAKLNISVVSNCTLDKVNKTHFFQI